MAEATLNDVSNAIREDGHKDREQLKGDSIRQFIQLRSSNKLLKSITQAQIDSNEQMKKQFEQEQEALRRANAKKTLGEPANDKDSRFKRMMIGLVDSYKGVQKLLDNIKKAMPNKATMFTLLFGGLAAAFAFFPKEVKEYLIDPLIDVINVFRGKDYTTGLGRVVYNLKEGLGWISENISPTAAWVAGIAGAAVALNPITTLTMAPKGFAALKAIAAFLTMPWIGGVVAIGAAILGAKLALDKLRDLSIESETELSEKALRDYEKATDPKERERIVEEQIARLKRNQDTTLKGVSSIEDPINEILKLNKDTAELTIKQAQATKLALELASAVEGDTGGGEDGSIDKRINEENNKIAKSIRDQVIAITKGKAPTDKEGLAEIYDILKKSIELNNAKETKAVIRGIKGALPGSFGMLSSRLAKLNSEIKSGEDLTKTGREKLNFAFKGLVPEELKIKNVPVESSEYQERIKTMYEGFDEMGNNQRVPIVPVVAPTTNDSRDQSTTTYYFYNDNTKIREGGLYSGTRLPAGF